MTTTTPTTRSRSWLGPLIAVAGAAFPPIFLRTAALNVGPYGGLAPVDWLRIATVWVGGLVIVLAVAALLWRLADLPFTTALIPATIVYWALAFFWRGNLALAELWDLPGQVTTAASAIVLFVAAWLLVKAAQSADGPAALALAMAVPMAFTGWQATGFFDLPSAVPSDVVLEPVEQQPGVWVIVLDAMPNPDTLDRLGWNSADFVSQLTQLGFDVPADSQTFSTGTYVTIGAALSLTDEPPTSVTPDEQGPWLAAMDGDHPLARGLTAAGYDYVMVDNAFSFSRCGDLVTDCRRYTPFSERELAFLTNSLATPFIPEIHPWTAHTLRQLDELERLAQSEPDAPRLIYTHLLMPHWPFDHSAQCEPATPQQLDQWRRTVEGFHQTMDCLSSRLLSLVELIPRGDVVLITGDHGSDLYEPFAAGFTSSELADRLTAFVAVSGCDLEPAYLTSNANAYRGVATCVTTSEFPPWPAVPALSCVELSGNVRVVDATEALAAGEGFSCAG